MRRCEFNPSIDVTGVCNGNCKRMVEAENCPLANGKYLIQFKRGKGKLILIKPSLLANEEELQEAKALTKT